MHTARESKRRCICVVCVALSCIKSACNHTKPFPQSCRRRLGGARHAAEATPRRPRARRVGAAARQPAAGVPGAGDAPRPPSHPHRRRHHRAVPLCQAARRRRRAPGGHRLSQRSRLHARLQGPLCAQPVLRVSGATRRRPRAAHVRTDSSLVRGRPCSFLCLETRFYTSLDGAVAQGLHLARMLMRAGSAGIWTASKRGGRTPSALARAAAVHTCSTHGARRSSRVSTPSAAPPCSCSWSWRRSRTRWRWRRRTTSGCRWWRRCALCAALPPAAVWTCACSPISWQWRERCTAHNSAWEMPPALWCSAC